MVSKGVRMSAGQGSHRIVVGVDGSEGSRRALAWAVEEAGFRSTRLEVVYAYEVPRNLAQTASASRTDDRLQAAAQSARDLVDAMTSDIDGVDVDGQAIESEDAASTLVERSRDAAMLVVGSRGHGGLRSLLLGSVSQACAQQATCPVVIIRADPEG